MKSAFTLRFLLFALLSALAMPLKSEPLKTETSGSSSLYDQQNARHLLLVAFTDKSINRIPRTATAYRKRGDYSSSTWSKQVTDQIAEDYHLQKLAEWPMTEVGKHCVVYQVPMSVSVADTLDHLTKDARVDIAQNMNFFNTRANHEDDPYHSLQSNLQAMQIDQTHAKTTGKNITIAMIDTGIDIQHPDLAGQISHYENFAESISAGFSNDKHGTAVAGIMVAKKDNGAGIIGVAPDATLIALKACWPDKSDAIEAVCNSFTLAMAVNTAIKSAARILNMSLTGPHDALLALLLNKAIAKGIIVVASDSGLGQRNANFPASLANVISVQSFRRVETDHKKFSRSIAAPGEKILTTLPHGTYDFISGSSISAAEVSGIIALLMALKPDLALAEVKSLLQKSEIPVKNGSFQGINANNAVLALCETTKCPQKTLSFVSKKSLADPISLLTP